MASLGRDQELGEATSELIPTTQMHPKYQHRTISPEEIKNVKCTHNIAVTGPGASLCLLSLPEVAHDVVEVLAHQLLHSLQPSQSLR